MLTAEVIDFAIACIAGIDIVKAVLGCKVRCTKYAYRSSATSAWCAFDSTHLCLVLDASHSPLFPPVH